MSLAQASKSAQLQEFVAHEEARGIGPVYRAEFDAAIPTIVKAPKLRVPGKQLPGQDIGLHPIGETA